MLRTEQLRQAIERRFADRVFTDTTHPNKFKVTQVCGSGTAIARWYLVCQEIGNTEIKWSYSLDKMIPMDEIYQLFDTYTEDDS